MQNTHLKKNEKESERSKKITVKKVSINKAATGCFKNNEKACDDCTRTDCPEEEA
jgi:hypothetical protein